MGKKKPSPTQQLFLKIEVYETKIKFMKKELQRKKDNVLNITPAYEGEVVSGTMQTDKTGNGAVAIVDYENRIRDLENEYEAYRYWLSGVVKELDNSKQIEVMEKHYFDDKKFDQVAREMGCGERNVCYIHGRALQAVEKLIAEGGVPDVEGQAKPGKADREGSDIHLYG